MHAAQAHGNVANDESRCKGPEGPTLGETWWTTIQSDVQHACLKDAGAKNVDADAQCRSDPLNGVNDASAQVETKSLCSAAECDPLFDQRQPAASDSDTYAAKPAIGSDSCSISSPMNEARAIGGGFQDSDDAYFASVTFGESFFERVDAPVLSPLPEARSLNSAEGDMVDANPFQVAKAPSLAGVSVKSPVSPSFTSGSALAGFAAASSMQFETAAAKIPPLVSKKPSVPSSAALQRARNLFQGILNDPRPAVTLALDAAKRKATVGACSQNEVHGSGGKYPARPGHEPGGFTTGRGLAMSEAPVVVSAGFSTGNGGTMAHNTLHPASNGLTVESPNFSPPNVTKKPIEADAVASAQLATPMRTRPSALPTGGFGAGSFNKVYKSPMVNKFGIPNSIVTPLPQAKVVVKRLGSTGIKRKVSVVKHDDAIGPENSVTPVKRQRPNMASVSANETRGLSVSKTAIATPSMRAFSFGASASLTDGRNRYRQFFGHGLIHRPISILRSMRIPDDVLNMSLERAREYAFNDAECAWGWRSAHQYLLIAGALESFVEQRWIERHYPLVVWKLACSIRQFPEISAWWGIDYVKRQLLHRYHKEYNGERSCLQKISDGDDLPQRPMVLCVASVINDRAVLTDGWFLMEAELDRILSEALRNRRLQIGQKLYVCGAQRAGVKADASGGGEANSVRLSLCSNSCFRARWDAKLGYSRVIVRRTLSSVKPMGGRVPLIEVIVCRAYPMLFQERTEEGSRAYYTIDEASHAKILNSQGDMVCEKEACEVSTFMRLLVCDAIDESRKPGYAMITIYDVSEALMGLVKEGARLKISHLKASRNDYKGFTQLYADRCVKWDSVEANKPDEECAYIRRCIRRLDSVLGARPLCDAFADVLVTPVGPVIGQPGSGAFTAIVVDTSGTMATLSLRPLCKKAKLFEENTVLYIRNVEPFGYDSRFGVVSLRAVDVTEISTANANLAEAHSLRSWMLTDEFLVVKKSAELIYESIS